MLSWKLKKCIRCGGDVFIDRDIDGWFMECLQCARRVELIKFKKQLIPIKAWHAPAEDWSIKRKIKVKERMRKDEKFTF